MSDGRDKPDPESITALLQRWGEGDELALNELTPLVYDRLHQLAVAAFRQENNAHTLQPTAVVNEAYLQLANASVHWQDSGHFYALAARMMRRILVNHANGKLAEKRGAGRVRMTYVEDKRPGAAASEDVLDLDEALHALAAQDERKAQVLELHYFVGLNYEDTARALDISAATCKRDLRFGKAWIKRFLAEN